MKAFQVLIWSAWSRVLLQSTLLQAALNTESHISGQTIPELLQINAINHLRISQNSAHQWLLQAEERLGRLQHTGIFRSKSSSKHSRRAVGVEFGVDSTLRKDCRLEGLESIDDVAGAVLSHELGAEATLDNKVVLGRARMCVRCVEATRTNESNCHADPGANKSWEDFAISENGASALARGGGTFGWVEEVIDKVTVVGDEADAFLSCGRELKLVDQGLVVGSGRDGTRARVSGRARWAGRGVWLGVVRGVGGGAGGHGGGEGEEGGE